MSLIRNFMSAKVRSNAGCWTCRLRRKKCDERRPVCDACGTLEITCHFGDDKPEWMDGGPKQKEMADSIKSQVKKQASQRRDRKYMELLESGTRNVRLARNDDSTEKQSKEHQGPGSDTDPNSHMSGNESGLTPPSSNTSGATPPHMAWSSKLFEKQDAQDDGGPDVDVHFVMIYLDYIFPYLFPFYRPPVLSGGRGWILDTLQSNKTVYYTAISLAAYFFGVVMANGEMSHKECTDRMAHKLQKQLEMGLKELQKEMCRINKPETDSDIYGELCVMQGIIQMVVFEVATSNGDNWKVHLDAAIALFFQIIPESDRWTDTLHGLYTPRWPPPSMGVNRPWSTNQAALRFFTANLMSMDVMSAISLERPPRLRAYQEDIIPGCFSSSCRENANTAGPLFMEDFVGLHNWIIQMIGDVATLDAWKKLGIKNGSFLTAELVSRGQVLADALRGSLQSIEENMKSWDVHSYQAFIVEDPLPELRHVQGRGVAELPPQTAQHNKIWLQGVMLYLYTTVFGWQPDHADIAQTRDAITNSLSTLPRGSCLRGMVFPFCIAGCLAPPEDEEKYRIMAQRMGPLQVFGTVKDASEIMEKVWSCRDAIDENWDMAKCLRILGHRTLLI